MTPGAGPALDGTPPGPRELQSARPGIRVRLRRQVRPGRNASEHRRSAARSPHGRCGVKPSASRTARPAGKARWTRAAPPYQTPAFYSTQGGPLDNLAWFLERILAASRSHRWRCCRVARRKAEKLTTVTVGKGANAKEVTAWAITGRQQLADPGVGGCQGQVLRFRVLPELAARAVRLGAREAQRCADRRPWRPRMPALAQVARSRRRPGAVAFMNVRVFDADAKTFLEEQTVLVG